MQDGHLRQHAVASFMNNNAAWTVQYGLADDDAAAHGQAMHEAAVVLRIIKPGFVNTPRVQFVAELLVRD